MIRLGRTLQIFLPYEKRKTLQINVVWKVN